jgi:hypothetical protein
MIIPHSVWSLWRSMMCPHDTWAPFVTAVRRLVPPRTCLIVPRLYRDFWRGCTVYALRVDCMWTSHPSVPPRQTEERREVVLARRAGQPRRHKVTSPATRTFNTEAARALLGVDGLPLALADALVDTKSGPIWNAMSTPFGPGSNIPPLRPQPCRQSRQTQ